MTAGRCLLFRGEQCRTHKSRYQVPIAELAERWTELPQVSDTYTQEPKHYDHLYITSWLTIGVQPSFNPPWLGCHKSLVNGWRQIVPEVKATVTQLRDIYELVVFELGIAVP
ncbi:hypothetical protein TNCV_5138401 [Trichonephila clavipes]|nr:hypothetical protein TNCV_5138401 [Trichonephila clavipes]